MTESSSIRILHVIVGEFGWTTAPIEYRRHRLGAYLSRQASTSAVYWVYPRGRGAAIPYVDPREATSIREPISSVAGRTIHEFGISAPRRLMVYSELLQQGPLRDLLRAVRGSRVATKVLWYTVPIYSRLLRSYDWDLTIYDCSDYWLGLGPGFTLRSRLAARLRSRSERRIICGSQLLFASSTFLADHLGRTYGRDVSLVENGVDSQAFVDGVPSPKMDAQLPQRPRLAFIGALKEYKIDFQLIASVAAAAPNWNFVLIGPLLDRSQSFEALLRLPNVVWLGYKAPSEVPALMKLMDVGLLPYRSATFNDGVFPVKFFEYLAAGLPVVGCGLPSTLAHVEDGVYVHTEATVAAFLDGCKSALTWSIDTQRRIAKAHRNDWSTRFEFIQSLMMRRLNTKR